MSAPTHRAVIALGSSVPDPRSRVEAGLRALQRHPWLTLVARSDVEKTPAAGGATLQPFANAACVIETPLGPSALLTLLHAIESDHGRLRTRPLGPRCLDLDLLEMTDFPVMTHLRLPHPGRNAVYMAKTLRQALTRAATEIQ